MSDGERPRDAEMSIKKEAKGKPRPGWLRRTETVRRGWEVSF